MKATKIMLLGIVFILFGIWGAVIAANGGGQFFYILSMGCPVIGIITFFAGIGLNN